MRYLMVFFLIVVLYGCEEKNPNTIHRSGKEMEWVKEQLLHLKKGDLIVMVSLEKGGLPDMDEVVVPPDNAVVGVKEVSFKGARGFTKGREEDILFYVEHYETRGAIHIIPMERVETFYLHVGSEAFLLSQQ